MVITLNSPYTPAIWSHSEVAAAAAAADACTYHILPVVTQVTSV